MPRTAPRAELVLTRLIDELHLYHLHAGSCRLRERLQREGVAVGRKHVGALMWRMGIEALYRVPDTSKRRTRHTIYPYLLVEPRELCYDVLEGFLARQVDLLGLERLQEALGLRISIRLGRRAH